MYNRLNIRIVKLLFKKLLAVVWLISLSPFIIAAQGQADAYEMSDSLIVFRFETTPKVVANHSTQVKQSSWIKEDFCKVSNHVEAYCSQKDIATVVENEYSSVYGVEAKLQSVESSQLKSSESVPELLSDLPYSQVSVPSSSQTVYDGSRSISFPFILKSNLIYDATLAPSMEIEYVINNRWSAGVETTIAWWHNNHKPWFYQIATLIPEVRYRIDARKQGHYHSIGLFGGAGWYDLEYKKTGYQGELWMAGLSYSYSFPINKLLGFEAGAGLGFMSAKYEEYLPIDGHFSYQQTTRTNFFGPLRLKFALVFDLNRYFKKGGMR